MNMYFIFAYINPCVCVCAQAHIDVSSQGHRAMYQNLFGLPVWLGVREEIEVNYLPVRVCILSTCRNPKSYMLTPFSQ